MLILLIAAILYLFLMLGAITFVLCALSASWRRYALSAALWWAVFGPCVTGIALVGGLGLFAASFASHSSGGTSWGYPSLPAGIGKLYLLLGLVATVLVACVAARVHQAIVLRMTFAFFRIYAMLVSAGIGSVFGWFFGMWLGARQAGLGGLLVWIPAMAALVCGFGYFGYRKARELRGAPPEKFAFVTREEFEGTAAAGE